MKKQWRKLVAGWLACALFCMPVGAAMRTPEEVRMDTLLRLMQSHALAGETQDILQNYVRAYVREHPDELAKLVNDILKAQDPYSAYYTPEQYKDHFASIQDGFGGIGITLGGQSLVIQDVQAGTPAHGAGVQVGDEIVAVDGVSVQGQTSAQVSQKLRGKIGTRVRMQVKRQGSTMEFTMERKKIQPEHVFSRLLAPHIAYIRIGSFGESQDAQKFRTIWQALPKEQVRAVVMDLRGNGGGIIETAQEMIETVVPEKGVHYLTLQLREDAGGKQRFYTPGSAVRIPTILILVDEHTASAAEIMAGALSDVGVAKLIGTKTFGKGVGQSHLALHDGSVLVMTSLAIELPKRGRYDQKGLIPDYIVPRTNQIKPIPTGFAPLDTQTPLLPSMQGAQVRAMTERLVALGYLPQVRTVFDGAVIFALCRFQLANALPLTGVGDQTTLAKLAKQAQTGHNEQLDNQLAEALSRAMLALGQTKPTK